MNDKNYLTQMEIAYQRLYDLINDQETKATRMITITGVIFSLQSSVLFPKLLAFHTPLIILLFSVIAYLISVIWFIKVLTVDTIGVFPTNNAVEKCYCYEYSEEEYINGFLGDYNDSMNQNKKLSDNKGKYLKYGFYFFICALILSIFSLGMVVLSYV